MGMLEVLKGEQPGFIKSLLHYENKGQFGEYLAEYALTNHNLDGEFVVLKNLYLPMKGKTTEIDLLMIHEKGIFVFESKNYSGWIFGSENQLKWTQCFKNGTKEQFYNPIKQNRTHIRALANLLQMSEEVFASYIVFSERCELKKIPLLVDGDVTILQRPQMLYYLRRRLQYSPIYYSHEEIERIAALLKPFTQITREEKQQHIENLQTKCPFCGSELVLRNGKYGQFWGCSSYPKCHYTRQKD